MKTPAIHTTYYAIGLFAIAAIAPATLRIPLIVAAVAFMASVLVRAAVLESGFAAPPQADNLQVPAQPAVLERAPQTRPEALPTAPPALLRESQTGIRRALIVGAGAVGRQLAEGLEKQGRYQVVGFVDDQIRTVEGTDWTVLGRRDDTAALALSYFVDDVFVAYAPTWQQQLAEDLAADCPNVCVRVVPSSYEALLRIDCLENSGDIALVRLNYTARRFHEVTKRALDCVASLITLILMSPILAVIAAVIKLTSAGPVIFAQERIGLHGRKFNVLKFRTMVKNAETVSGPVLSSGSKDSRLTSVGRVLRKFRLDEIPQFWNVLRGEMSLVGPRPERPVFVERFQSTTPSYARRHSVRPGITGFAQVCGNYHTDARDKLRFDLIYVSHQSIWLDIYILARTVGVILFAK